MAAILHTIFLKVQALMKKLMVSLLVFVGLAVFVTISAAAQDRLYLERDITGTVGPTVTSTVFSRYPIV